MSLDIKTDPVYINKKGVKQCNVEVIRSDFGNFIKLIIMTDG